MKAIIVAYSVPQRTIGLKGVIPWMGHMPADMRHVRDLTTNNAIIMGRRTFESIGRPLPNRQNIVISSKSEINSIEKAFSNVEPGRDSFIFGGANVYRQAVEQELVDVIFSTEIKGEFEGDTFFPELDPDKWKEVERQDFDADSENKYPYSFVKYERVIK